MIKFKFLLIFIFSFLAPLHQVLSAAEAEEPSYKMGLLPSPPDAIQRLGALELRREGDGAEAFPTQVNLKCYLPPVVYHQGNLHSCTGHALGSAVAGRSKITGAPAVDGGPSRLFIYYGAREQEGTIDQDAGASLYAGLQSLRTIGFCSEMTWAYDAVSHKFKVRPSEEAYAEASHHKVLDELGVAWIGPDIDKIKAALANNIFVPFGMSIFSSFDRARYKGLVPMPHHTDASRGGHAMLFIGYDDNILNLDFTKGAFIFQNSWGEEWGHNYLGKEGGKKGYGSLPYNMVPLYVTEAWGILHITGAAEAAEKFRGISFHPSDYRVPQPTERVY